MRLDFTAQLRTRVARRMLLLFLVGAVLPVAVLCVVVYLQVSRQFHDLSGDNLRIAADLSSQAILGRLSAAETELRALGSGAGTSATFDKVSVALPDSAEPLTAAERARLQGGASLVRIQHLADGRAAVLLAVPDSRNGSVIWGRLSESYLWSAGNDDRGLTGGASCAFTNADAQVLHCDARHAASVRDSILANRSKSARVRFDWKSGDEHFAGVAQQVFLKAGYGTDPWWLVIGIRTEEAQGRLAAFTRTFAITIGLAIVVAFLLSNVQIRRNLEPLANLTAATRRIGDGDFSHRVEVKTTDEFGVLAESFNRMTTDLDGHFQLLRVMAAVDRASLSGEGAEHVANVLAAQCRELFQAGEVAIGFSGLEPGEPWTTVTHVTGNGRPTPHRKTPTAGDLDLLESTSPFWYFDELEGSSVLRDQHASGTHPRLIVPLRQSNELLGYLALSRPGTTWSADDELIPEQLVRQIELGVANGRAVERLERLTFSTLEALARTIDASSPWTAGHSERVTQYALRLGREMQLTEDEMITLHRGGLLHDIGKIAVPATILDSPNPLSAAELAVVRSHPVVGARILEPIRAYAPAIPVVLYHHERFDGSGYPHRLAGEAIPKLARVAAVADVYDALTSKRPYRSGWTPDEAVAYICKASGVHFDPTVVAALTRLVQGQEWSTDVSSSLPPVS